ncbi:divergent polysaccharide deacetylase family protein [Arenibacterium sp. CAU 1754]
MRGFLSGVIWGGVVSAIGVVVFSLLTPLAPRPEVGSTAPATADIQVNEAPDIDVAVTETPDADLVDAAPAAPEAVSDEADQLTAMETADTTSAEQPDVSESMATMSEPEQPPETAQVQVDGDAPVSVPAAAEPPKVPDVVPSAGVAQDDPDRPEVPTLNETLTEFGKQADAPGAAPEIAAKTDPTRDETDSVAPVVSAPATESLPVASTEPAQEPVAEEPAVTETPKEAETEMAGTPDISDAPAASDQVADEDTSAPEAEPVVIARVAPEAEAEDPEAEPAQSFQPPQISALPEGDTDDETTDVLRPQIGKRVVPLTERDKPGQITAVAPVEPVKAAEGGDGVEPLKRYAVPFENPENRPLMSILLIDDKDAIGVEALRDFPYPLTFAVDPNAPDAAEKMARHRESGFEVVALIDLPENATAQDAEVALAASFEALPETVGMLEGTGTGIQGNRTLSDQVTAFAGSTGRGLITQGNGLNTVQKLAVREGVRAAPIFRDFDGAEQSPSVMRRFLDQAAFRAGQEGAVIMMGRVRPDTVSALLLWGLQDRAARVALAPVSAVLEKSVAGN